jgi:hypothetical protein
MRLHHIVRSLALACLAAAPSARASDPKSYLELALTKTDEAAQSDQGKAEHAVTVFDISGGFSAGDGLILGGKYFNYGIDDKLDGALNGEATTTIKGWGPMIGYMHPTLAYITATYLYQPEKDVKAESGSTVVYNGGSGYAIALGKAFEVGKSVGLALQLEQAHVDYKTVTDPNGNQRSLTGTWYDQMLHPYVGVFVFF